VHGDRLVDTIEQERHTDGPRAAEAEYMLGGEMKTMRLGVELTFESTPRGTDEQFELFLEKVVDELDDIGREVSLVARLSDRCSFGVSSYDLVRSS
jgi:hypothetical protein